jgi:hypothetical protein
MRLWSINPCYLDSKGLVALWREALLAQKVLRGETQGYRHHSQLERFKACSSPLAAIATYLHHVYEEASRRGYHFDKNKIGRRRLQSRLPVTTGQLEYEFSHLKKKIEARDPALLNRLNSISRPKPHSLFRVKKGTVEKWEASWYAGPGDSKPKKRIPIRT